MRRIQQSNLSMSADRLPINKYCPRPGKPDSDESLVEYRDTVVGFCNTGYRDDFAANVEDRPSDGHSFDVLIKELEIGIQ